MIGNQFQTKIVRGHLRHQPLSPPINAGVLQYHYCLVRIGVIIRVKCGLHYFQSIQGLPGPPKSRRPGALDLRRSAANHLVDRQRSIFAQPVVPGSSQ
jgi:hypothetical protein